VIHDENIYLHTENPTTQQKHAAHTCSNTLAIPNPILYECMIKTGCLFKDHFVFNSYGNIEIKLNGIGAPTPTRTPDTRHVKCVYTYL
jgi:hypothetical protein